MNSIYKKITAILAAAFILQIILVGIFYRQVMVKQIIEEISTQDNARQKILQNIYDEIAKDPAKPFKADSTIENLSEKYHLNIDVIDSEDIPVISYNHLNTKDFIYEHMELKKGGKIEYTISGYFPARINNIAQDLQIEDKTNERKISIFDGVLIFLVSLGTMFLIYIILTEPLKKLSKAVAKVDYGNTLVQIPYYNNDEFGKLCRNFEAMGKMLRRSEDNQLELIQAVSHDIKTPLTSIIGFSKRLMENKVAEERKADYYETVFRKAIDLEEILEELEEYANNNVENQYCFNNVNIKDYMNKICTEFSNEAEQKGYIFNYDADLDENSQIYMDIKKMKRVFINIINNSLKYAGESCIITLTCKIENHMLDIVIDDNGEGIPEEFLNKIFDRFYRVDTSRSREKCGTGLGLAICKEIIEKHHGSIAASNNKNGGLRISLRIPVM